VNSEFDIINRYFKRPARNTVLGIGDDAALIATAVNSELAVSTDTLVSGKHFFPDTDPYRLGYKSLAVNLSDMAAMGATPRWVLLALTLPDELASKNTWLSEFSAGFFKLADQYQVTLVGGDTTAGPLNICVQIIGEVTTGKALRRSGAQLGDDIWISGRLGDAALALNHELKNISLAADEISQCLQSLLMPTARVELGQRLIGLAHSAIDISDGLLADLGHILTASEKAACIAMDKIPCSAILKKYLSIPLALECLLAGGDDYELCFTASPNNRNKIAGIAEKLDIHLTRIGEVCFGDGVIVKDGQGKIITLENSGYEHFSTRG